MPPKKQLSSQIKKLEEEKKILKKREEKLKLERSYDIQFLVSRLLKEQGIKVGLEELGFVPPDQIDEILDTEGYDAYDWKSFWNLNSIGHFYLTVDELGFYPEGFGPISTTEDIEVIERKLREFLPVLKNEMIINKLKQKIEKTARNIFKNKEIKFTVESLEEGFSLLKFNSQNKEVKVIIVNEQEAEEFLTSYFDGDSIQINTDELDAKFSRGNYTIRFNGSVNIKRFKEIVAFLTEANTLKFSYEKGNLHLSMEGHNLAEFYSVITLVQYS